MQRKRLFTTILAALALAGCSSAAQTIFEQMARNASAYDCATPAAQQAFVDNLPLPPIQLPITEAQLDATD